LTSENHSGDLCWVKTLKNNIHYQSLYSESDVINIICKGKYY